MSVKNAEKKNIYLVLDLVLLIFRMEIIPDKDQLYYVLTTDTIK